ncbi:MAG: 4'-phosphopantetheinyl transferase superfamily protein [Bacteroidetes bacterium]|nr:4'-phosphopantetheinyl transferase superfamily protein [Bacteroidota bacterium]
MPLLLHKNIKPSGEYGIWEIREKEDFFLRQLPLIEEEREQLNKFKGRRRTEWLAVRYLIHHMSGRKKRSALLKDTFGKPHLEGASYHISISHSHEMAAAIAAPVPVGIDIQYVVSKIDRIAHKYMRPEELESLRSDTRIEHLHVYWGAKEALYKAYGRKKLHFITNILIEPFSFQSGKGIMSGKIKKENYEATFNLYYEQLGDYILVYAVSA